MAKRSYSKRSSQRVKVSDKKEEIKDPETVLLQLAKDLNLNIVGKVTGKKYNFPRAGSVVAIDKRDVDEMMKKRSGACGGCPSSVGPTPYFKIVE